MVKPATKTNQDKGTEPKIKRTRKQQLKFIKSSANKAASEYRKSMKGKIPTRPETKNENEASGNYDVKEIIDLVLRGLHDVLTCNHILIGASSIYELFQRRVGFTNNHSILRNHGLNPGDWAENAFVGTKPKILEIKPSGRSNVYPFLSAVGDFVIKEGKKKVCVEIKSSWSVTDVKNIMKKKDVYLQLWATMEILGFEHGKLLVYYMQGGTPVRTTGAQLYAEVTVTRKISLFANTNNLIVQGYMAFLRSYIRALSGLSMDLIDEQHVVAAIIAHANQNPEEKRLNLNRFRRNNDCVELAESIFRNPPTVSQTKTYSTLKDRIDYNAENNAKNLITMSEIIFNDYTAKINKNFLKKDTLARSRSVRNFVRPTRRYSMNREKSIKDRHKFVSAKSKDVPTVDVQDHPEKQIRHLDFDADTLKKLTEMRIKLFG